MEEQIPLTPDAVATDLNPEGNYHELGVGVAYKRLGIVNVVFIGPAGAADRHWVLVDAGIQGTARMIRGAAEERFTPGARPAAIILTHGHFDHVGALEELAEEWDAPIYAHALEHPFLDGSKSYPTADADAGGGLMARLSPLFPRKPIDVSKRLMALDADGTLPFLSGWKWLHTPGHTPGHVSFWRPTDRTLVVGDAFITTRQESVYAALMQKPEMHGPPRYFTPDWRAAEASVKKLSELEPNRVITGHGAAMEGLEMRSALKDLAANFPFLAVPEHLRRG